MYQPVGNPNPVLSAASGGMATAGLDALAGALRAPAAGIANLALKGSLARCGVSALTCAAPWQGSKNSNTTALRGPQTTGGGGFASAAAAPEQGSQSPKPALRGSWAAVGGACTDGGAGLGEGSPHPAMRGVRAARGGAYTARVASAACSAPACVLRASGKRTRQDTITGGLLAAPGGELAVLSGGAALPSRDAAARAEREAEQRCRVRHRLAQLLELRRPPSKNSLVRTAIFGKTLLEAQGLN